MAAVYLQKIGSNKREVLTCWEGMVYCTGLFEFDPLSELAWFNILLLLLLSRLLFITVGPETKIRRMKIIQ